MQTKTLVVAAVMACPLLCAAAGDSPWLPIPGQFSIGVSHTEQRATEAYIGSTKTSLADITGGAASEYKRSTTSVRFGYGLSDAVSLDATLGHGKVRAGAADDQSGMLDTTLGVNWRVLDEFEKSSLPTLTLRGAAIVKGDYKGDTLAALGNGANGVELAVLLGKQVTPNVSLWGELGVQHRDKEVPNATFVEVGARYRFAPQWSASAGYTLNRYGGDLDIGGPGFTPARFQQVRAERGVVKLGVGYALAGNQGLALNFSRVTSGRNTVNDDRVVGLSYVYGF